MKSPVGWGLASMWYDKYPGLPRRGSPLETLFVLVRLQRTQAEILSTRALVQSIVGLHEEKATQDPAIAAYQEFCDKMLPFLDRAVDNESEEARKRLADFVKSPARINLNPVYKQQAEHAKKMATLKRFKLQPKLPGTV